MKILYRILNGLALGVTYLATVYEIGVHCEPMNTVFWGLIFTTVYFGAVFYLADLRHDPNVNNHHSYL